MTNPQQPINDDLDNTLKRVHLLGSATENLFERLYRGLNRKKQLQEAVNQLEKIEVRNHQLGQALKEKSIEVQRLNAILASISEGIVMQDTDGRALTMNSAAEELLGSKKNFWQSELGVLFRESRDMQVLGSELVPLGEAKRVEIDNKIVSAQIAAITDQNDERIGTLMVLRDVTSEDISERMKNSFMTHISHELLTPLAPMRVASELLLNAPADKPPNQRMLHMISKNVDILARLVNEMLDMSSMTSGNFTVAHEAVNLELLIWEVVTNFAPQLQENDLEIVLMLKNTENLELTGDPEKLEWAVSNILRNAIQYSLQGQSIWFSAGTERDNPQQIFIEIADQGVGISDEDLPNIFELFYRGDARTETGKKIDPRGLGQGLFVSKTVVEAHGGKVTVESSVGQGSTFNMYLPRNMPKALPS